LIFTLVNVSMLNYIRCKWIISTLGSLVSRDLFVASTIT
jgi:hypothetical protein